jgi:uncharacterized protein
LPAAVVWWLLYQALIPVSEAIVAALPVDHGSHQGGALQFFFCGMPKVLLLSSADLLGAGDGNLPPTREESAAGPPPGDTEIDCRSSVLSQK